jgi:ribosomal protein L19E
MSHAAIPRPGPLKIKVEQANFQSPAYLEGIRAVRQEVRSMQEKAIIDRERLKARVQL